MAGYKISFNALHDQGNELLNISKDMVIHAEEIIKVSKQLSDDPLFLDIITNLKTLIVQLTDSYTFMSEAGKILVNTTQKYQAHEVTAKQIIMSTGVTKTDYNGNSASSIGASSGNVYSSGHAGASDSTNTAFLGAAAAGMAAGAAAAIGINKIKQKKSEAKIINQDITEYKDVDYISAD